MRISYWSSDVCSSDLTEYARGLLPTARIAACPGCYPTAALLALLPLVEGHAVDASTISVFAMSGVSGAGRSLKEANLFPEVAEARSEEHTSELQSLMRISYAVFCLKKKHI